MGTDTDRTAALSRRRLMQLGGAGSLAALVGAPPRRAQGQPSAPSAVGRTGDRPRHVVFMVSDGMSMGTHTLAEPFSRLCRDRPTHWEALLRRPDSVHGLLATASLNSLVTDSAAAASAWGSGSRVNNGVLNELPDGRRLTPIAPLLQQAGRRMGFVTTDLVTGGTPSGFAAVSASRNAYDSIAPQFLGNVDVLLGGGGRFFTAARRADKRDLVAEYRNAGYAFADDRDGLLNTRDGHRLLGLFGDEQLPYTIDHLQSEALRRSTPTLAEMTRTAMRLLAASSPDGFFLLVEGARIDHAAHLNDAAAMLWDQLAFDDAVGEALAFAAERGDTLVVVTTDHGNGNPGLTGMGGSYADSTRAFEHMKLAKASFGAVQGRVQPAARSGDADAVAAGVKELLGVELSANQRKQVTEAMRGKPSSGELWRQQRAWFAMLAQALANQTGVGFFSTTHTADHALLTALGPGAGAFAGLHPHTDVFRAVTDFYRIRHTNPTAYPAGTLSKPIHAG